VVGGVVVKRVVSGCFVVGFSLGGKYVEGIDFGVVGLSVFKLVFDCSGFSFGGKYVGATDFGLGFTVARVVVKRVVGCCFIVGLSLGGKYVEGIDFGVVLSVVKRVVSGCLVVGFSLGGKYVEGIDLGVVLTVVNRVVGFSVFKLMFD
jgi:hypothetical protein